MSNFKKRLITGAGLFVVVMAGIWLGPYGFTVLLLVINYLSLQEFYRLLETSGARPVNAAAFLLSGCMISTTLIVSSGMGGWPWFLLNLPVGFGIFVAALYRRSTRPFPALAISYLGIICICIPVCCFLVLAFLPGPTYDYQPNAPLSIFLLLWANDSGAYLSGKAFGKHPLFHRISPNKTWEGSFGGATACLLMSGLLSSSDLPLTLIQWLLLATIIIITGTYGDLVKSLLKRSLKVKDSGTILPGHGGMLDRFDSLYGSAPFVLIYLIIIWR